jgi:methyl-accepting chemotaxis protein
LNTEQAELLANKLDKLNEFFDITTSTIDEINKEVQTIDSDDIDVFDESDDIITIPVLKKDFNFIRETLLQTVEDVKRVINKISLELDVGEGSPASIISAYAELVGTVNNSLKLLSSTYKDIVDINNKLIEKKNKKQEIKGDINFTNNIISTSVADVLSAMKRIN